MNIRNVTVFETSDDFDYFWTMTWEDRKDEGSPWRSQDRILYGCDTLLDAKKEVVAYFGGLVTMETING